jgi:hypothetical protein
MKSVTFSTATKTKKNCTAYDLRDQVIAFLTVHGMAEQSAKEITSVILDQTYEPVCINPDCANSDFTRALALFQLIFSGDIDIIPAYIAYRPKEGGMRLTVLRGYSYGDVIDYIKDHMEITIA